MPKDFAIGYVHNYSVDSEFMGSVVRLMNADRGQELLKAIYGQQGLYIAENRNKLVQKYLEAELGEYLLLVDTDIIFTPQDCYDLLDFAAENRPIVTGVARTFLGDLKHLMPCWMYPCEPKEGELDFYTSTQVPDQDRLLRACGMGFCIVHRLVFEKMAAEYDGPYTWFAHDIAPTGKPYGEDVGFCIRAQNLGFPIWGKHDVVVKHAKRAEL